MYNIQEQIYIKDKFYNLRNIYKSLKTTLEVVLRK